jgi:hypothetical protein
MDDRWWFGIVGALFGLMLGWMGRVVKRWYEHRPHHEHH